MKKIQLFCLMILSQFLLSNSSCEKQNMIDSAEFGREFSMKLNEPVLIPKSNAEVTISLDEISDSRCPEDVTCVWAGNATIKLKLKNSSGDFESIGLCIGSCSQTGNLGSSQTVILGNQTYTITLKEVNPFPRMKNGDEIKTATLILTK